MFLGSLFGFGDRLPRLALATIATFLVSGIWHGAAWHFVIWGLVCGVLVLISHILTLKRVKIPHIAGIAVTFVCMMLVRVLFDAECMTDALAVYRALFSFRGADTFFSVVRENLYLVLLLFLGAFICFFTKNSNDI